MDISVARLGELGFTTQTWMGNKLIRSVFALDSLYKGAIMVAWGDGYSEDYMVWLCADTTHLAMKHIRTIEQICALYRLVEGKELRGGPSPLTVDEICNKVSDELPEDCVIAIGLENGAGWCSLHSDGVVYMGTTEGSMQDSILDCLAVAKGEGA